MPLNANAFGRAVRRHAWKCVAIACLVTIVILTGPATEAHKGITSKYNYNIHVFPILRDRCALCHYEGGPAPMSLSDWMKAVPWAESAREHLITERMPPWYVDQTGPVVRGGHFLPTKDLDQLLSWLVGGTPRFDEKSFVFGPTAGIESPVYEGPTHDWVAGAPPDLKLQFPEAFTVPSGTIEADKEFTIPTGLKEERWVRFVDLLPSDRSMVRDAVISVQNGPVLAAWVPGHQAIDPPSGSAFKIPAGAVLHVKVHYKKNYNDEQTDKTDRSTIGLYFTDAPLSGRTIESLVLNGPSEGPKFTGTLRTAGRVVGFRPSFDQAYASVLVEAVANGKRVPLLKLRAAQPQWYRRYWLQEPIELPAGTVIEVTAVPAPPDDLSLPVPQRYPLQVAVEYVPF